MRLGRLPPWEPAVAVPGASLQSGHGPPSHPDPRRRHRSGAGGGDHPRPRRDRHRVRMGGPSRPARPRSPTHGTPLPEEVLESIRRNKVALKGPITTPVGGGFRSVNVDAPPGARAVRQPAPGALDAGRRDALRGRRPRHRPREHRGPLRRHRAHGRPRRGREHQDHHPRARRSGSPASPSTTPSPTAATRSRPSTRPTS